MWLKGPLTCRLPSKSVLKISDRLVYMRQFVSTEFCRRPRPLSEIDRYKATEFRQLLLYTGLVAFCGIVEEEIFSHFLLSVAICCLVSPEFSQSHADYANQLLVMFVEYASRLYGQEFIVYNVHCLIHLSDDVKRFGPLDSVSCFPFENYLKQLKKMVRSSHRPFQQVVSRLSELNVVSISKMVNSDPVCQSEHSVGPLVDGYESCIQYRSVRTCEFTLNLSDRDNCVIANDGCVGIVKNILLFKSEVYLVVCVFQTVSDLFVYPLHSSLMDIYRISDLKETYVAFKLEHIRCKCVRLPIDNASYAAIPLIHASY